ncbi:TetR/AcrR family transcriptional regulator [Aliiroseovarius sp. CAU 1755]
MARPAKFTHSQVLDAATRVAAQHRPSGATMVRVAQELGAPTGSLYHRFASRSVLLGEVWLRTAEAFQQGFGARLAQSDPIAGGLATVRYVPQWVRKRPEEARIMLLFRQSEFLCDSWPEAMSDRARDLRRDLSEKLLDFCDRAFGCRGEPQVRIATYALAEAPLAAVRMHIEMNLAPPPITEAMVEATFLAAIELGKSAQ